MITTSLTPQRDPGRKYFWPTVLVLHKLANVPFSCEKRVLLESKVMTTGQVPCIAEYRNNKFFFVSILYVFKIQNDDVSRIRNHECMTVCA